MKTTIYELLGMVKDGKIPKKIKYHNDIWEYIEEKENYIKSNGASLNWDHVTLYCLKEPVEILEEPKGIPEKLKIEQDAPSSNYYIKNEFGTKCALTKHSKMIAETLNQVIDYLESKGE